MDSVAEAADLFESDASFGGSVFSASVGSTSAAASEMARPAISFVT